MDLCCVLNRFDCYWKWFCKLEWSWGLCCLVYLSLDKYWCMGSLKFVQLRDSHLYSRPRILTPLLQLKVGWCNFPKCRKGAFISMRHFVSELNLYILDAWPLKEDMIFLYLMYQSLPILWLYTLINHKLHDIVLLLDLPAALLLEFACFV